MRVTYACNGGPPITIYARIYKSRSLQIFDPQSFRQKKEQEQTKREGTLHKL